MQPQHAAAQRHLHGRIVVITRPSDSAASMVRLVRAAHGVPVRLPGLALRGLDDAFTRQALGEALRASRIIFSSPAAVRHAQALQSIADTDGAPERMVIGVGQGTARALRRAGIMAPRVPPRQDSEGVLGLPELQRLHERTVALIGAPGGRGLLREQLAARGAIVHEAYVYRRVPPRLDRRHVDAVRRLPADACVLWSSAEAMAQLQQQLPGDAWAHLCSLVAVVSSERLGAAARAAGFVRRVTARSALPDDLLDAAAALAS